MRLANDNDLFHSALFRIGLFVCSLCGVVAAMGQQTIKFDQGIRSIQFNQPFVLQVDNVTVGDIIYIAAYETHYQNHTATLYDPQAPSGGRPAFILRSPNGFVRGAQTLKINIPAIRPERNFDLLVYARFSDAHLKTAIEINMDMYNNQRDADNDFARLHPTTDASFSKL